MTPHELGAGPDRRLPRAPGWLIEVARPARGPAPWAKMGFAALAIGVPPATGLAVGQTLQGVLAALGGLVGALADRDGPYPMRVRRIVTAGVFGGAAGLLVGTGVNGRGWLVVGATIVVAGASAVLSSVSAAWSVTGLFLLVFTAMATGPLGVLLPWWQPPLWLLAGVGWALALLVPGWLLHPRAAEQRQVAAVYRALAANLRALGTGGFDAARRNAAAAVDAAYEELFSQRAAARGREPRLSRLLALLEQGQLAADAVVALSYTREQAPPQAAAQADTLANAVLDGNPTAEIGRPSSANPAVVTLYDALTTATAVVSASAVVPEATGGVSPPSERGRPLAALAQRVREGFASTFAIRLMLCIGVAGVFTEVLPLQRSYWVLLAIAFVMKPDFGSVFARALQYSAGTVIGALVGALILAPQPPDVVMLVPVVVFAALLPYGMSRNYGMFGAFVTPLVVLLIDLISQGGWQLARARLIDILLGCGIVLVLGYAPWPTSWHTNVPRDFAAAADAAARYLDRALGEPAAGAAAAAHTDARTRLAALRIELQRALAEPRRVHQRVTAWWPAVVALEQLVEAVAATAVNVGRQPPPAAAVAELGTAVRRIAAAVRSGTPARPEAQLPGPPSLELVTSAVRSLQHVFAETPPAQPRPGLAHTIGAV